MAIELTRILVDEPMSVILPPRIAANESGIRNFDGLSPRSLDILVITGKNTATTAVLFIKADTPPAIKIMNNIKPILAFLIFLAANAAN